MKVSDKHDDMSSQPIWILCILVVISFASCGKNAGSAVKSSKEPEKWVRIFNGKDLSNWRVKIKGYPLGKNFGNTFRAEDGVIRVDYSAYEDFGNRFGHLFFEIPYSSYRLKLDYRFTGQQAPGGESWALKNSGIMVHSQAPESMGIDQDFPVSVEVQLLGGVNEGEERPTANVCTPGTHITMNGTLTVEHCLNSVSETYYHNKWVNVELMILRDSLIIHKVNGKEVLRYSKPVIGGEYNALPDREGEALTSGYIALQSESHPIEFKDIEIMNLEPALQDK